MIAERILTLTLLLFQAANCQDPRHAMDPRCPLAVTFDPPSSSRPCEKCEYLTTMLPSAATVSDCATACCGDWSCLAFRFAPTTVTTLSGIYENYDSLRGVSNVSFVQNGGDVIIAHSLDPTKAFWKNAVGRLTSASTLWLCFDCGAGDAKNNRSGTLSADNSTITFSRLPFDPANFTQSFVLLVHAGATCVFMDDTPPLTPALGSTDATGIRAWLPPRLPPPFPISTLISSARVSAAAAFGLDGDEFPITWARDGTMLTGAGDNTQPSPGINASWNSPASFFRVEGGPPQEGATGFPAGTFSLRGDPLAIADTDFAKATCPPWFRKQFANIKSSGVLAINDTVSWAVSCFNYGDDPTFNRQRYGPAWILTSFDSGTTWSNASGLVFGGRLAAPRFIQAGQAYDGALDPNFVYVLFPGTENNASFFECNDAIWLGRAPIGSIVDPTTYEFFVGTDGSGAPMWSSDDSIAERVIEWPLHVSVQQANWHAGLQRYIAANWVWISSDGNPRPDHSPDERNDRTARQRTWLTLLEAPQPWGPWSVFYSDDNWRYSDDSSGAYTPVIPSAWINTTDNSFYIVSTQCCGVPQYAPTNHYSFNAQRVDVTLAV